jgi:hypothetical protein
VEGGLHLLPLPDLAPSTYCWTTWEIASRSLTLVVEILMGFSSIRVDSDSLFL